MKTAIREAGDLNESSCIFRVCLMKYRAMRDMLVDDAEVHPLLAREVLPILVFAPHHAPVLLESRILRYYVGFRRSDMLAERSVS